MERNKVILIIMDGWGLGSDPASDAIGAAKTPFVDSLFEKYPNTTLITCGEAVGLPAGQMGNSEVGHLNLGAGRIVYQELQRINVAIADGSFARNPMLAEALLLAEDPSRTLHLMGLVSDGGVHSHINHLTELLTLCSARGLKNVMVHAFTDGRDTDPKSGVDYINSLLTHIDATTGTLATVTGRYYAMDRDKRWERVKIAYDCLVHAQGDVVYNFSEAIELSYTRGVTDEFLMPMVNGNAGDTRIKTGDVVICFNFRTDRCREITEALTQHPFPDFSMAPLPLHYFTMTQYDETYRDVKCFFLQDDLRNTLGEVLSAHGRSQLRIAETEKYPHVSFFFSGGREVPFEGEKRLMIPSPKVATYDLKPEMSAYEVTENVIQQMRSEHFDFICLNFANPDMVGHTGVWNSIIAAVETVDECVEKVVTAALEEGYEIFLTADHGNADYAINPDGSPNTAHTLNPVPLFLISKHFKGLLAGGKLADIAPTILHRMQLPVPAEMTGNILVDKALHSVAKS